MTRNEFRDAVAKAEAVVSELSRRINERKRLIDVEFSAEKVDADCALRDARAALQQFDDAEAMAAACPPYPAGTVVEEWGLLPMDMRSELKTHKRTGTKGVIEIITRKSRHPDNLLDYSRARVGSVVIRIMKKDGTLGVKYIEPNHRDFSWGQVSSSWKNWRPEGVDLNEELHAQKRSDEERRIAEERAKQERLRSAACEAFGL